MKASAIELFKNMVQLDINNVFYDFHNDYNCIGLKIDNNTLELQLQKLETKKYISIMFTAVEIVTLNFEFCNSVDFLTLDNLYRGRFETNGVLQEFKENGKSYFYLEFYEGQTLDFFCEDIEVVG